MPFSNGNWSPSGSGGGGGGSDTDSIIVSPDYTALVQPSPVAIGDILTTALGKLQGQIQTLSIVTVTSNLVMTPNVYTLYVINASNVTLSSPIPSSSSVGFKYMFYNGNYNNNVLLGNGNQIGGFSSIPLAPYQTGVLLVVGSSSIIIT